jgi:hypothetical protein
VPRLRALVIMFACVVGALLGLSTFGMTEVASQCGGFAEPGAGEPESGSWPTEFCEERLGSAAVAPGAPGASATALLPSTATRHVPTGAEPGGRRGPNPVTDRAMAMLIGWMLLALIGGGFCAGRRSRRQLDTEMWWAAVPDGRRRTMWPFRKPARRHALARGYHPRNGVPPRPLSRPVPTVSDRADGSGRERDSGARRRSRLVMPGGSSEVVVPSARRPTQNERLTEPSSAVREGGTPPRDNRHRATSGASTAGPVPRQR